MWVVMLKALCIYQYVEHAEKWKTRYYLQGCLVSPVYSISAKFTVFALTVGHIEMFYIMYCSWSVRNLHSLVQNIKS